MAAQGPDYAAELDDLAADLVAGRVSHVEGAARFARLRTAMDATLGRHTDAELLAMPGNADWQPAYKRAWEALDDALRRSLLEVTRPRPST